MQQPVPLKGRALSLRDTVDIAVLQRIQDTFAKAMGFAAVTVDRSGQPVTRDSSFLQVCRMIRSTETGRRRCMQCDAEGGLAARERRGPHVYVCKGGLLDIAAPIIIEEEYLGCILCGQVLADGRARGVHGGHPGAERPPGTARWTSSGRRSSRSRPCRANASTRRRRCCSRSPTISWRWGWRTCAGCASGGDQARRRAAGGPPGIAAPDA